MAASIILFLHKYFIESIPVDGIHVAQQYDHLEVAQDYHGYTGKGDEAEDLVNPLWNRPWEECNLDLLQHYFKRVVIAY
jgi:hypothetical protein